MRKILSRRKKIKGSIEGTIGMLIMVIIAIVVLFVLWRVYGG